MLKQGDKNKDVQLLQRLLNVVIGKKPVLIPDGDFGGLTTAAVMEAQHKFGLSIDGTVSDDMLAHLQEEALALGWQKQYAPGAPAPWLKLAGKEVGVAEIAGPANNPKILEYIATFPYLATIKVKNSALTMAQTEETAWCACFVNWCLLCAGQVGGPGALAESWLKYGTELADPVPGAITVIYGAPSPGTTASGWHVGFWLGGTADEPRLLGGNQGNQVSDFTFDRKVKGWRWPG